GFKLAFAQRSRREITELTANHAADRPAEHAYCASDHWGGDASDITKNWRGPSNKTPDASSDSTEEFFAFELAFKLELAFHLEFVFSFEIPFAVEQTPARAN